MLQALFPALTSLSGSLGMSGGQAGPSTSNSGPITFGAFTVTGNNAGGGGVPMSDTGKIIGMVAGALLLVVIIKRWKR